MDEKYLEKYTSKSANLSQASNNIKGSYVSLIIISIICYVESIYILSATWSLASEFGSSGIGTFYMFIIHIIAICLLGIIGLLLFLFEYCIKRIIKTSINFKLNKICLFLFTGGFILPILTLMLIPIISIAFDIKLGTVGIGKLFPFQTR